MQGDIVAVYNMDGEKIGTYTYDAWGNFTVTLTSEELYSKGLWFWKRTYTRYIADVTISDVYDFNTGTGSGDGLGSILNNIAHASHEKGIGKDYAWTLSYSTTRRKQKVSFGYNLFDFAPSMSLINILLR